jgi:hemoglobin-like flavoprotein
MTSQEIILIRDSFHKLAPIVDSVIALFYARLFELDPSLRLQCCGAMEVKSRTLRRSIGSVVGRLEQFEALKPTLRRLGARQAWRGASEEHYSTAGVAFLWALEKALGAEFTPATKAAWTRFYVELANTMLDGAHLRVLAA